MATGKQSAKQPADSKGLQNAVHKEAQAAEQGAREGNVATVKETSAQPAESLPTGARSHPQ